MAEKLVLSVGTKRGLFLIESNLRRQKWTINGPFLKGWTVHDAVIDTRGRSPRLYAAAENYAFASTIFSGPATGKSLKPCEAPPAAPKLMQKQLKLMKAWGISTKERVWKIEPGHEKEKRVLYAGTAPAGLFRSEDSGKSWQPLDGLNKHKTRKHWGPGAGGMSLHSIQVDPHDSARVYTAISAAGGFRSDDAGESWTPINNAVAEYVGAPENSGVGTCVHKLLVHPSEPGCLYQQNHVGVYKSTDYGNEWTRIDEGLPYDFGFGLALDPADHRTCFVIPLEPKDYAFRATDGALAVYQLKKTGNGWKKLTKGLPTKHAYVSVLRQAMTSDRVDPCGVYFGTAGGHLFGSNDAGTSWQRMAEFFPPIYSVTAAIV